MELVVVIAFLRAVRASSKHDMQEMLLCDDTFRNIIMTNPVKFVLDLLSSLVQAEVAGQMRDCRFHTRERSFCFWTDLGLFFLIDTHTHSHAHPFTNMHTETN